MDDRKKGSQDTTGKKSEKTEFSDEINMDSKSNKSNSSK